MSAPGKAVIESGSEMSTEVSSTIRVAVGSGEPERAWSASRSVNEPPTGGGKDGAAPGVSVSRRARAGVGCSWGTSGASRSVEGPMRRATALLVLVLLVLSSCGGDDDTVGTDSSSTSSSTSSSSTTSTTAGADPTTPPTKPAGEGDDPAGPSTPASSGVIRISVGGGFSPYGADFAAVPTLVLADGTAFTGGATTMQYPGPAISPVSTGTPVVDAGRIAARRGQGTPGSRRSGTTASPASPMSAPPRSPSSSTARPTPPRSTPSATRTAPGASRPSSGRRGRRCRCSSAKVGDAVSAAATGTFAPTAYQVLSTPSQPASSYPDPKPNTLDWPVSAKPLVEGPCRDLTGADADAFRSAADEGVADHRVAERGQGLAGDRCGRPCRVTTPCK